MSEIDDHLLEAFQKVTITIPLVDAIGHIFSYTKFLEGICTLITCILYMNLHDY